MYACSCVEDILLDMQFVTQTRASPLLDFCASEGVGHLFSQAQSGWSGFSIRMA